jgi:hypothetical protein
MQFLNLKAVLSLNGSGFQLGMKRAESQAKAFSKEIKGEFAKAFGTAAIIAYTTNLINFADTLTDVSDRLGVSTKDLQEWAHAAKRSGSSIEAVTAFLEQLNIARKKALDGDSGAMASFNQLGISEDQLRSMTTDQLGRAIGGSVKDGNIQEMIEALRDVGGRGAGSLVATLKALEDIGPQAKIITDEDIENIKEAKAELLDMVAVVAGPFAKVSSFFSSKISDMLTAAKMGGASAIAFAKTLTKGGSVKDAWGAANEAFDSGLSDWERRQKAKADNIATRNKIAGFTPDSVSGDVIHNVTPLKVLAEKVAQGSIQQPGLTSWQSAGAAIRFNPDRMYLERIARASEATARNTSAQQTSTVAQGGFGAFQ